MNSLDIPRPSPPILKAERVLLRPPRESDKQDRIAFGREAEYRRMVGLDPLAGTPLTMPEVERWFAGISQEQYGWIIESEGRGIGQAKLHSLDTANRRARYAIGIFSQAYWNRGLGTEATNLILEYAFENLHLHRVDLRVLAFNHRAIACYEKCGFVREGIEREGAWIEGEWQSDVMMSILEQEYRRQKHATVQ